MVTSSSTLGSNMAMPLHYSLVRVIGSCRVDVLRLCTTGSSQHGMLLISIDRAITQALTRGPPQGHLRNLTGALTIEEHQLVLLHLQHLPIEKLYLLHLCNLSAEPGFSRILSQGTHPSNYRWTGSQIPIIMSPHRQFWFPKNLSSQKNLPQGNLQLGIIQPPCWITSSQRRHSHMLRLRLRHTFIRLSSQWCS